MALSPSQMQDAVIKNLETRTGKTLNEWIRIAKRSRLTDRNDIRKFLKAEHGLGMTTCYLIAEATRQEAGDNPPTEEEMLKAQFRGDKEVLRPVYDKLVREMKKLGSDVTVGVRKTQTTFARKYTFAIAKAPTKTRIDLGLRLPTVRATKRLKTTTAFCDNATHCVSLSNRNDIDDQIMKWLAGAYKARS